MTKRHASEYRSLQQIAAKNLYADLERTISNLLNFSKLAPSSGHEDSIQKLRKVQRRMVDHMHKGDAP